MKWITFLALLPIIWCSDLKAQRTYPVDSCIYFISPADFLVRNTRTAGPGSQENLVVFRSSTDSDPGLSFSGRGAFVVDTGDLPAGVNLTESSRGRLLLNLPSTEEESDEWPGGSFDYPSVLTGFLETIGTTRLDSFLVVNLQVIEFETEGF